MAVKVLIPTPLRPTVAAPTEVIIAIQFVTVCCDGWLGRVADHPDAIGPDIALLWSCR